MSKRKALKLKAEHFRAAALTFLAVAITLFIVFMQTTTLIGEELDPLKYLIHETTKYLSLFIMIVAFIFTIRAVNFYNQLLKIYDPKNETADWLERLDNWFIGLFKYKKK